MATNPDSGTRQFTLEELCRQAGVTVRTVRYYISEGLLPPPHGQGLAARYGNQHLQRLLAIAHLKEQYLPLREIRRVLGGLDETGIAALARSRPPLVAAEDPQSSEEIASSPAASYIQEVLGHPVASTPRASSARSAAPAPEKTWRRLPITADAELLIDTDLYDRRQEQIESLLIWAKRLLSGS